MLKCLNSLIFLYKKWLIIENEGIRRSDKICTESPKQFIGLIWRIGQDI